MDSQAAVVKPSSASRRSILAAVGSQLNLCFTCGSCSAECPVNAATGKLDPRAMVRRAAYGQLGPMLDRREIWYCLQCNRCSNVCPMNVTPGELLRFVRRQALADGKIATDKKAELDELLTQLQRVRHRAATTCQAQPDTPAEAIAEAAASFDAAAPEPLVPEGALTFQPGKTNLPDPPPAAGEKPVKKKKAKKEPPPLRAEAATYGSLPTHLEACFTCYECRDACPVCREPQVYDPLRHFRGALLDADASLDDPSIWLCIGCQSCTEACAQGVQGHTVMLRLQQLARQKKRVDEGFDGRWQAASAAAYRAWVERVDALLDD